MSPLVLDPHNMPDNIEVGDMLVIRGHAYVWDGELFIDMGPMEEFLAGSNRDVMEGKPTAASTVVKPSKSSE